MLLYNLLLFFLTPFVLIRLLWKSRHNRAYRQNIRERFAFSLPPAAENTLWVHTVSVGEFLAARPLLLHLLQQNPRLNLWITCTTPTGREQIKAFQVSNPQRVQYSYLPYDLRCNNKRALEHINPQAIILMETEIWPNLILQAKEKNIPVLLINARLSARSLRGYYRFARNLLRELLQSLTVNAQTREDARRFYVLGAKRERISITPNIKYQSPVTPKIPADLQKLKTEHFQWLAASTHSGEEEIILRAQKVLQQKNQQIRLIIAPRHPERRQEIINLIYEYGFIPILRSKKEQPDSSQDILILDTLGELSATYHLVNVAFIGGSFVPHGGHNPLEALHAKIPVVFGSSMFNFAQISAELITHSFATQLTSPDPIKLAQTLQELHKQTNQQAITNYIQPYQNVVIAHADFILKNIGK